MGRSDEFTTCGSVGKVGARQWDSLTEPGALESMGKVERQWLLPSNHDQREPVFLRASEMQYTWVPSVPVGYLFDGELDAKVLTQALKKTLEVFPALCGRLRQGKDKNGHTRVGSFFPGSKGCLFESCTSNNNHAPESASNPGTNSWKPYFVDGLSRHILNECSSSAPLFRAKLTFLTRSAKSVLTMSFAHCIVDGASIIDFIHTWSYFCGEISENATTFLPSALPQVCAAQSRNDLEQYDENLATHLDQIKVKKFGLASELAPFLAGVVYANIFDSRLDFTLDLSQVKTIKERITAELPEGEWVSSYEVMMAMMLQAYAFSSSAQGDRNPEKLDLRILANTRGRDKYSPKGYVGNALSDLPVRLENPKDMHLSQIALAVHDQMRSELGNAAKLEEQHLVFERSVRDGRASAPYERLRHYHMWLKNVGKKSPLCNSWIGYDWFGVTFGGQGKPYLMRVPPEFSYHRMIFISPRTPDQVMVRMQIPSKEAARFKQAVQELNLPLTELAAAKAVTATLPKQVDKTSRVKQLVVATPQE